MKTQTITQATLIGGSGLAAVVAGVLVVGEQGK
jgi:hypothetical protein